MELLWMYLSHKSEPMFCPQTIREMRRKSVTGVQAVLAHCYIICLRVLDLVNFLAQMIYIN